MPSTADRNATARALAEMPSEARAAFQRAGDWLRDHLQAMGYREHPDLLLQTSPHEPFLGRCFFSKDRIVCLTIRSPRGTLELWLDKPYDPADVERSLLVHFPSGFRDYHYLGVEEEANPEQLHGLSRDAARDPATFPDYLKQLLATPHLALILQGKFWHSFFYDARELYLGDYTKKDLADSLRKSLMEQGFGEGGK